MAKLDKPGRENDPTGKSHIGVRSAASGRYVESSSRGVVPRKASAVKGRSDEVRVKSETRIKKQIDAVLAVSDRPEFTLSPFEKMGLIENGISKKALENLKDKAGLDYDQLAKVLNVARATLISKKGKEKFTADVSDKILGLADIYSYGYEVFEDRDNFNQWVFSPNRALRNQAPFDFLHNSFGREEV